jgi:hypothetical protein
MKTITRNILLALALVFTSCASSSVTKIGTETYAPIAAGTEVAVFTSETQIKQPFEVVGIISYDNAGLGDALEPLKEKARSVGYQNRRISSD